MKEVIQLLRKILIHNRHKRAHSKEVIQGLEKAETNFRDLRRGIDPVSLKVERHENDQWKGFQELRWHNGNLIEPFSESSAWKYNVSLELESLLISKLFSTEGYHSQSDKTKGRKAFIS